MHIRVHARYQRRYAARPGASGRSRPVSRASLGALVDAGVNQMEGASWMLLVPAVLLALILLCFNFLGDAMRDVFDARSTR